MKRQLSRYWYCLLFVVIGFVPAEAVMKMKAGSVLPAWFGSGTGP